MTKHVLLRCAIGSLGSFGSFGSCVAVSGCDRVVDLVSTTDASPAYPGILDGGRPDAETVFPDGYPGSLDVSIRVDAAAGPPDAVVVPPDAAVVPPDAAVVAPAAAPTSVRTRT